MDLAFSVPVMFYNISTPIVTITNPTDQISHLNLKIHMLVYETIPAYGS